MSEYDFNVFINCPFDDEYNHLLWCVVFAVHDCGFVARSALEISDSGQVRIEKITSLIAKCRLGIHDLSRTELDKINNLPRFNMPLELGIFLGAKWVGTRKQQSKIALILDTEKYRYHKFCSDIAGQDIGAHGNDPAKAVRAVRNWLNAASPNVSVPSAKKIWARFEQFSEDLPLYCEALNLDIDDLTFNDYTTLVVEWQEATPW